MADLHKQRLNGARYKLAALCLALISPLFAWGIYAASEPSAPTMQACLNMGGSGLSLPGQCHAPGWTLAIAAIVLFGGWGAAWKVWKGE